MQRKMSVLGATCGVLMCSMQWAYAEMVDLGGGAYHFFEDGYGSLVVVGKKSVLVSDPAWSSRAENMKKEIASLTDKPISHVVLSHEHYDHAGGTEVFKDAEIVCQDNCQGFFDLDVLGSAPEKVTMSFKHSLSIDLGNKVVDLHHWASGDGVASTVLHVPSADVAALSDLYEGPRAFTDKMWLDDKNVLGARVILNNTAALNAKHVIGGHSDDTNPQALQEHAEFHNDIYEAVKAKLDAIIAKDGAGAAWKALGGSLQAEIRLPEYQDWKGYDANIESHVWRTGMSIMHGG